MSMTAIVCNYNYAKYLPECLESALRFCDKVLVYDDASTDASVEICEHYGITPRVNDAASGGPVWGSNLGIEDTKTSHFLFLDSDNFLISKPPEYEADYTFSDIPLANEKGWLVNGLWRYYERPTTAQGAIDFFVRYQQIPVPWGGVWRTDFVQSRNLRWRYFETTKMAADYRTCIDWILHDPTLTYTAEPFLAFRQHDAQWSASPERQMMEAEACLVAASIGETLRSPG